jgi:hypothetical protein
MLRDVRTNITYSCLFVEPGHEMMTMIITMGHICISRNLWVGSARGQRGKEENGSTLHI